jgi:myo-inositol-1(or 4)-monophosphatase
VGLLHAVKSLSVTIETSGFPLVRKLVSLATSSRGGFMEKELAVLTEAVRLAGQRALELARDGFDVHVKQDRSPVTSADLEVNRILAARLTAAFPNDGWLSEETPDTPARLSKRRVWIIDPIDGTKSFARGLPTYCISAALVEQGIPVVGVVYSPATEELFSAIRAHGLCLNGKFLSGGPATGGEPIVFMNPWEMRKGPLTSLTQWADCRPMPSIASAMAFVAAGRADAAVTLERENEWDLAAATLFIEESRGIVTDRNRAPLAFNRPHPWVQGLLAFSAHLPEAFQHKILDLVAQRSKGSR